LKLIILETRRSPFSLNVLELIVAIVAGNGTWFALHYVLWDTPPWPYRWDYFENEALPLWFIEARQELFGTFAIPMSIIIAVSAIFLVRAIGKQDFQHFTRICNFAMSWPIFSLIFLNTLSFLSLYCLPIGLVLAIMALEPSRKNNATRDGKLGVITAVIWNIVWVFLGGSYFGGWWTAFGD